MIRKVLFVFFAFATVNDCFDATTVPHGQNLTKELPPATTGTNTTSCPTFGALYKFKRESYSKNKRFPDGFIWGAATSSYQTEGAWNKEGKGKNIWDNVTHAHPERIADHSNGDVAANSYEFYKEDVRALKKIGMKYYRFSISWARVLPNGDLTTVNHLGLEYYNKLINELLDNGIQPVVTIFHWDMPQKLQDIGGMVNPLIVDYFVQYAKLLFERFGDRVKIWNTINEPVIMCEFGYGGRHAPFVNSSGVGSYLCGHHALLVNAKIYRLYHEHFNKDKCGKIGIVFQTFFYWPKNPKKAGDIEAANRSLQFWLGRFAHPIFSETGGYPKIVEETVRINSLKENLTTSRLPVFNDEEKRLIQGTSDYFFLNYYTSAFAEAASEAELHSWPTPSFERDQNTVMTQDSTSPVAVTFWLRSIPDGLRALLNWVKKEYNNPPVIITENGWSDHGEIEDSGREQYLKGHLHALLMSILEDGCNVHGHFTWSLIEERFGLFNVDFTSPNKTRTAKNSVQFLRKVISTGEIPDDGIFWEVIYFLLYILILLYFLCIYCFPKYKYQN